MFNDFLVSSVLAEQKLSTLILLTLVFNVCVRCWSLCYTLVSALVYTWPNTCYCRRFVLYLDDVNTVDWLLSDGEVYLLVLISC